jgi:hypothetical protein
MSIGFSTVSASTQNLLSLRSNGKRAAKGDVSRIPSTLAYAHRLVDAASKTNLGELTKAAGAVTSKIDKVGESAFKIAGANSKLLKVSGYLPDTLHVLRGIHSVAKDEHKGKAIVENGLALGGMFGAEYAFNVVRNPIEMMLQKGNADGAKGLSKKLMESEKGKQFVTGVADKIGSMSKGQKTAAAIGMGVAFAIVGGLGFSWGKKLGQALTGRKEEKPPKTDKKFIKAQAEMIKTEAKVANAAEKAARAAARGAAKLAAKV